MCIYIDILYLRWRRFVEGRIYLRLRINKGKCLFQERGWQIEFLSLIFKEG